VLEERGNQLRCETLRVMDILDVKIDGKESLMRPLENVGHDARLSKTARGNEVDVVSRQQIPNTLDDVFTPEQFIGFRYAARKASNRHSE
jgi:hypothetical protein